uniref:Uncharacterized protein n=1 Tax=Arundo donax TaxID=35708 RepID=A0A0A9N0I1_ARUDO
MSRRPLRRRAVALPHRRQLGFACDHKRRGKERVVQRCGVVDDRPSVRPRGCVMHAYLNVGLPLWPLEPLDVAM